jgi:hypothetical protein
MNLWADAIDALNEEVDKGHNPDRCVDCRYEQGRAAGEATNERWRGVPDRVLLETTDPGVSR